MRKFSDPLHFSATLFLFNIFAADGGRCNMFHGDFMQIPSRLFFHKTDACHAQLHTTFKPCSMNIWCSLEPFPPRQATQNILLSISNDISFSLSLSEGRNFPSTWEWIFHSKSEEKSLFVTTVVETVYNLLLPIKEVCMESDQKMWVGSFWAVLIESFSRFSSGAKLFLYKSRQLV